MLPTVAITCDDGPSEWTAALLIILAAHDAHATFFLLGSNIAGNEEIVRRTSDEGHELGIHGWDHKPVAELTADALREQIERTGELIEQITGIAPRWWKPPWNRADEQTGVLVEQLGLNWVRPTIDAHDVTRSEEQIVGHVLRELAEGAIIGMHDGIAANGQQHVLHRENTVRAVDRILKHCRSVTVGELLG